MARVANTGAANLSQRLVQLTGSSFRTRFGRIYPEGSAMTTISKDANLITFINVFTVDPANQPRLVELLIKVTDTYVRHATGFVSSSLHRGRDGTKVTMYAQWRSLEDYEAMRSDPGPLPYLQEALTIAKFEPGIYEVVESFAP
jgi:Antibiotic biosynthesis monooxygenase